MFELCNKTQGGGARIKKITSQNINSYCCRKAEGDKKKKRSANTH